MSGIFWMLTIVMAVIAFAFIAHPFLNSSRRIAAALLAIAIPTFAALLYMVFGAPSATSPRVSTMTASAAMNALQSSPRKPRVKSVASMVDGLAERLEKSPDDGKGWLLLARSYKHLGRLDDARDAYAQAMALGERDPDLAAAIDGHSLATTSSKIVGQLSLSDRVASIVRPDDTVFIFARSASGSGAPAAVIQLPAKSLPSNFQLDDSKSMVAGIKLSDFEEVYVTARISRSGDATESLQGLETKAGPISITSNETIQLRIE